VFYRFVFFTKCFQSQCNLTKTFVTDKLGLINFLKWVYILHPLTLDIS
jgi:hypothetical protein